MWFTFYCRLVLQSVLVGRKHNRASLLNTTHHKNQAENLLFSLISCNYSDGLFSWSLSFTKFIFLDFKYGFQSFNGTHSLVLLLHIFLIVFICQTNEEYSSYDYTDYLNRLFNCYISNIGHYTASKFLVEEIEPVLSTC